MGEWRRHAKMVRTKQFMLDGRTDTMLFVICKEMEGFTSRLAVGNFQKIINCCWQNSQSWQLKKI